MKIEIISQPAIIITITILCWKLIFEECWYHLRWVEVIEGIGEIGIYDLCETPSKSATVEKHQ